MRRNRFGVVVFALALAVQVLAPVVVKVAMARTFDDAGRTFSLCLQAGDSPSDNSQRLPGHNDLHRDACLLCQLCCDGIAPIDARSNYIGTAPVQWTAFAWTAADRALPTPHHDHSRQPRAPPAFS